MVCGELPCLWIATPHACAVAVQDYKNIFHIIRDRNSGWTSQPELMTHLEVIKMSDCCPTVCLAGWFNLPLREQSNNQPYLPWVSPK